MLLVVKVEPQYEEDFDAVAAEPRGRVAAHTSAV